MSSPLETQSLTLSSLFWKEDIWLPPNMTWEDVKPEPGSNRYTNFGELWYPVPAALVIILVRAHVMRYNYPHHDIERSVWWYYMFELSFYWSLSFSQFFDVRRKDFIEMFIHHLTTIALLSFSWTCNLTRCGALVLIVHDFSDIFLELAKMFHYAKLNTPCDVIFGIFVVAWIFTRLGLFPTWILFSATIEAPQMVEMFPAYYIFNGLLSVLLVLHVIWTYFILKIAFHAVLAKKDEELRDSRSDSEDDTMSESDHDAVLDLNKEDVAVENAGKAGTNGLADANFLIPSTERCKDIVAQDLK